MILYCSHVKEDLAALNVLSPRTRTQKNTRPLMVQTSIFISQCWVTSNKVAFPFLVLKDIFEEENPIMAYFNI